MASSYYLYYAGMTKLATLEHYMQDNFALVDQYIILLHNIRHQLIRYMAFYIPNHHELGLSKEEIADIQYLCRMMMIYKKNVTDIANKLYTALYTANVSVPSVYRYDSMSKYLILLHQDNIELIQKLQPYITAQPCTRSLTKNN